MKQLIVISLIALLISAVLPKPPAETKSELELIWKAPIGLATYRTIPVHSNGSLFIGSNGLHLRDYALDLKSGVYKIDLKSGKVLKTFADERLGDMDVNGIVSVNNTLIFGNDNDELLCYSKAGDLLWRVPILGDLEGSPIPITVQGSSAVAISTEAGQLAAFDVKSGRKLWSKFCKQGNQQFEEEINTYAKVNMYFYESSELLMSPVAADINGDATTDLILLTYTDMVAYSGATGNILWETKMNELGWPMTVRCEQFTSGSGSNFRLCIPMYTEKTDGSNKMLFYFDRKGQVVDKHILSEDFNAVLTHPQNIIMGTSSMIFPGKSSEDCKVVPIANAAASNRFGGRFTDGQCANNLIQYNNEACIMACFQNDSENDNKSVLVLIGTQTGMIHLCHVLPDFSEFTPIVGDANADGMLDVLINCTDEQLYCYNLNIQTNALLKSK